MVPKIDMCEKYLYSTITLGSSVKHQRMHVECKVVEEYVGEKWSPVR